MIYELARQCFGARVDIKELAVINEDLDMDHEVRSVGGRNAGLLIPPVRMQLTPRKVSSSSLLQAVSLVHAH